MKNVVALVLVCFVLSFAAPASASCYDGFCGTSVKASKQPDRDKLQGRHADEETWNDGEWVPITISTPRETKRFERI